jgi:hypothetical protein
MNCKLKNILIEFCANNYLTSNGLVNGANGTFGDYTNTSLIALLNYFLNVQIGFDTRIKYLDMYEKFLRFDKCWTQIKQKLLKYKHVIIFHMLLQDFNSLFN